MEVVVFKNKIWELLREVTEDMAAAFRPVGDPFGLTMLQLRVLFTLCESGPYTVGGLARSLSIADANTSSMCKRLEKLGYLERVRDTHDERVVRLAISEQGRGAVKTVQELMQRRYSSVMADVPEEEIRAIIEGMEKLDALLRRMTSRPE